MSNQLRSLNPEGLRRFEEFLGSLTTPTPLVYPEDILADDQFSDSIGAEISFDRTDFARRFDLGEHVFLKLQTAGLDSPERNRGIWAWLGLFWFNSLCPPDSNHQGKPGALARWIPELDSWRRYYRHLVLGPFLIYRAHSDDPQRAMALLNTPPASPGEVVEQLASRQMLVSCPSVVGAATALYCQGDGRLRRGVGGKDDAKGGARRLAAVLQQFDLTFDLPSMTTETLLGLLPIEFARWRR